MSLSSAINIANSGLTIAQRLAQTTSENIANAQTEGYGRRELALSPNILGGVRVDGVSRLVNDAAIGDRRLADAGIGRDQPGATVLASLERSFGPVGDASGVAGRLAGLEQALISASADPSSDVRLNGVLNRLQDLTTAIRYDADAIMDARQDADQAIAKDIETLNASVAQVAELNADITRLRYSGQDPSALIDARQTVVDKISSIVPVKQLNRDNDQIALYTQSGAALIDGKPAEFVFAATPTIVPAMTFAGGALSGVTINGQPADANNGFGRLKGGSLEANFTLRDTTLPDLQANLDSMAADLITRFEDTAVDPTLLPGDPGLLTDGGGPLDPLDITGLSLRLEVNANVDPDRGGTLTNLRDGVNAVALGPVGDNAQFDRWLGALRSTTALEPGGATRTAAGHAADRLSDVATRRLLAEEELSFSQARYSTFREAELALGVDTDRELQNLIRIEQAFAANARVVQTLDQMIRRVMEI